MSEPLDLDVARARFMARLGGLPEEEVAQISRRRQSVTDPQVRIDRLSEALAAMIDIVQGLKMEVATLREKVALLEGHSHSTVHHYDYASGSTTISSEIVYNRDKG